MSKETLNVNGSWPRDPQMKEGKAMQSIITFQKMYPGSIAPVKQHYDDAGYDLFAYFPWLDLDMRGEATVYGGQTKVINTGIRIAIPFGYVGLVCPRSGMAVKYNITVINAPGVIDSGYRGEIRVILHKLTSSQFQVRHGDRIAQLVVVPIHTLGQRILNLEEVLPETTRGEEGFGSTGV